MVTTGMLDQYMTKSKQLSVVLKFEFTSLLTMKPYVSYGVVD